MSRRYIHIFCGVGMGKTSAALGKGFREASGGKSVVVIRFLKKSIHVRGKNFSNSWSHRSASSDLKSFRRIMRA